MKFELLPLSLATALVLTLSACSKTETPADASATPTAVQPAQSYDVVAAQGKGFTVGSMMSANTVFVLFDPQCPHCGHLWQASVPLQKKVKFVWIPVAIMNPKSTTQGAALLAAANPVEAMTAHEASILDGSGGMSASSSVPDEIGQTLKSNTQLFNSLGVESVPFIVAKNQRTGQVVTRNGALSTPALVELLGMDPL